MSGALMSPRDRVTVELWDVRYFDGGFGKHGNGPFLTKARAAASLRACAWPGEVEPVIVTMDRDQADARFPGCTQSYHLMKQRLIVWPGHVSDPVMWCQAPDWKTGFFVDAPFAGQSLAGYSFAMWHAALTDAMHWAYHPNGSPPEGWRIAFATETHDALTGARGD